MSSKLKFVFTLTLCVAIPLLGCKRSNQTPQTEVSPAAQAAPVKASEPPPAPVHSTAFDPASVPLSSTALPPFPYLDWPQGLAEGARFSDKSDFDRTYVIAGNQLRPVEGRIESRRFADADAQLTPFASQRNYATAIQALGGVKVNTVLPDNPALVAANGGDSGDLIVNKLRLKDYVGAYDAYLIRTPAKTVWITVTTSSNSTQVTAIEEKAMQQQVGFVTSDAMQSELNAKGHVALYINFDTDQASIKTDGLPAVDEIAKLLNKDTGLKLSVEGHTDNSGNGAHNKTLSQQRAEVVVSNLVSKGIDKTRLAAVGFGADQPIADNASDEGRAKNRRVELVKM